jgi:hypothetical protein
MPLQHEADLFLKKALDHYFGPQKPWHFYSIDKQNRVLVSKVSKVIVRLRKRLFKFSFMKEKKE